MRTSQILSAWSGILNGRKPSLSIEITKECPLRCPGCYAFEPGHVGDEGLRGLSDYKGSELVENVLKIVDREKPLHLSIVGGDPLVRYREVEQLLPELEKRGIHTQIVTSAFRIIPSEWKEKYKLLNVSVSIDGLQPEHDVRRKPATYERILKNIAGAEVTIHSTITGNIASRPGYIEEFLRFWTPRPEIKRVWFSLFTPQRGAEGEEILTATQRVEVMHELLRLRKTFPKLDMSEALLREIEVPLSNPDECIFARTTTTISADLQTRVTPCQFGGDPDCSQCGCIATLGLSAVGHHKLVGGLTVGHMFQFSDQVGVAWRKTKKKFAGAEPEYKATPFPILPN